MRKARSLALAVFAGVLACALVCTLPAVAEESEGSVVHLKYLHEAEPRDREPWARALAALAQHIVALPFEAGSATRALHLIRAHASGPLSNTTDWSYQVPRVRITGAEVRVFPDSLEQQMTRPWFRPSDRGGMGALDLSPEEAPELDERGEVEMEADDGTNQERPRLFRPSLLHVLALRSFPEAVDTVLELLGAGAGSIEEARGRREEALDARCTLAATLKMSDVTPLHLLAIYAPDIDTPAPQPSSGAAAASTSSSSTIGGAVDSLRTAQLMVVAGANCSAMVEASEGITPLVIAGERGHENLLRYFLSQRMRPSFGAHWATVSRTHEEQTALGEWALHRQRIVDRDLEPEALASMPPPDGGDEAQAEWDEYLRWYDSHRPKTEEEKENDRFAAELFQTLQLSVVSNRLSVVRMLLSTPAYGLDTRVNERSHGGEGDALLHGAIVHGLDDMVALLLDHGADVHKRSFDGLDVAELARQHEHAGLAALLEKRLRQPQRRRLPPQQQQQQQQQPRSAASPQPQPSQPPEQKRVPKAQDPPADTKPASTPAPSTTAAATTAAGPSQSKYQQAKDKQRQKKQRQQQQQRQQAPTTAAATAQASGRPARSQHDEL